MLDDPDPFRRFERRLRLHRVSGPTGRGPAADVMSANPQDGTAVNTRCNAMKAAEAQLLAKAQSADSARDSIDVGDPLLVVHGIVAINEHLPTSPDRPCGCSTSPSMLCAACPGPGRTLVSCADHKPLDMQCASSCPIRRFCCAHPKSANEGPPT
ncbi:hypothetical protein ACFRDV_11710 [Streptomyces fagopyri]|uniref:SbtR family transcriptional regulator n=1 Tax=Streptomyces fagopyri TaxID=2662397 RepID=UPI0036A6A9E8